MFLNCCLAFHYRSVSNKLNTQVLIYHFLLRTSCVQVAGCTQLQRVWKHLEPLTWNEWHCSESFEVTGVSAGLSRPSEVPSAGAQTLHPSSKQQLVKPVCVNTNRQHMRRINARRSIRCKSRTFNFCFLCQKLINQIDVFSAAVQVYVMRLSSLSFTLHAV